MSEVLLIQPPSPTPDRAHTRDSTLSAPPIALGYLASVLMVGGFDVEVVDMEICGLGAAEIEKRLGEAGPGLVGLSTTTLTYKNALRIAKIGKSVDPDMRIVLGGPHVTFTAENALEHEWVDFVIRGEGELPLLALARAVLARDGRLANVPGLSFRDQEHRLVHVPRAPLIQELDSLPLPARHLLPLHLYSAPGTVITGRGCRGRCIFCAARAMAGGRYRLRSIASVLDEVELLVSTFGLRFFFFADDTFTALPRRTRDFCRALRARKIDCAWMCETRADAVDRRTLGEMAGAGCKLVQFGAESGSQRVLDSVRKGITVEKLRQAVATSVEEGMQPTCSFMFPHLADTRETVAETMELMRDLREMGARMAVSLTTPFPGTCLSAHWLSRDGFELIGHDTDCYNFATPVITTPSFDEWEIREIYMDMVLLCLGETGGASGATRSRGGSAEIGER